jgi:O-antigen ligase
VTAPPRPDLRATWERLAPGLVLFILPIAHTTPARFTLIVLSALSLLLVWRRHDGPRALPLSTLAIIAWWAVVAAVASLTSTEPSYSWGEFRNEVLAPLAMFVVLYRLTDTSAAFRVFRAILFASALVVSALALITFAFGADWQRGNLVGDRNAFSTYVVLIAPLLIACWRDPPVAGRAGRWLVVMAMVLAAAAGAATANRNMWFAIALEALVFGVVGLRASAPADRMRVARRLAVVGIVGALALTAILAVVINEKAKVSNTSTEEQARFDRDPRFEIWRYAKDRIAERPWSGYGFGRGILRRDFRTHFGDPLKWHGHNMAIDYVMEAGVIGGVTIVTLFFALYRQAWRTARAADPEVALAGTWVLAMLVGVTFKVMTDDILVRESALLFWSSLAIAFGLAARKAVRTSGLRPA